MNSTNKLSLEELENSVNKQMKICFEQYIDEIPSKTPVKAELSAKSLGNFVEIFGKIDVILILECDLCLKEYEYVLAVDIDEMFSKGTLKEEYGLETEIKDGQFVTDLEGADEIDIYDLLYQSVIINFPNKKVCGINCKEGEFETDETYNEPDTRMEVFKNIKIEQ